MVRDMKFQTSSEPDNIRYNLNDNKEYWALGYSETNTPSFIVGIKLGYKIICNIPSFIEGIKLGYKIICNIPSFIEGIMLGYKIILTLLECRIGRIIP